MALFNSKREKRYWLFFLITWIAIYGGLFLGRPMQKALWDQDLQFVLFLSGFVLTIVAVIVYALQVKPKKLEVFVWIGLLSVFIMLTFRLGAPERSHLLEYCLLMVFLHGALKERIGIEKKAVVLVIYSTLIVCLIGTVDEGIQAVIPNRVFDPQDIIFNCLAALMTGGGILLLGWTRNYVNRRKSQG